MREPRNVSGTMPNSAAIPGRGGLVAALARGLLNFGVAGVMQAAWGREERSARAAMAKAGDERVAERVMLP